MVQSYDELYSLAEIYPYSSVYIRKYPYKNG